MAIHRLSYTQTMEIIIGGLSHVTKSLQPFSVNHMRTYSKLYPDHTALGFKIGVICHHGVPLGQQPFPQLVVI